MSTVRRAAAALTVPLVAASLVTPCGTAHAAARAPAPPPRRATPSAGRSSRARAPS
ncbi:hypothetical protein ACFQHO_16750 [Actinomadura yumaensis]|uniref:hypothetical protein n=1 Tax=Actinomadura yumaensis TaxID=111807 RepID=UPI00361789CE